jgi:hypothetical protein
MRESATHNAIHTALLIILTACTALRCRLRCTALSAPHCTALQFTALDCSSRVQCKCLPRLSRSSSQALHAQPDKSHRHSGEVPNEVRTILGPALRLGERKQSRSAACARRETGSGHYRRRRSTARNTHRRCCRRCAPPRETRPRTPHTSPPTQPCAHPRAAATARAAQMCTMPEPGMRTQPRRVHLPSNGTKRGRRR